MSKTFIADKETLDKVYSILASDEVYGFIEHNATLAPGQRIEYIWGIGRTSRFLWQISRGWYGVTALPITV